MRVVALFLIVFLVLQVAGIHGMYAFPVTQGLRVRVYVKFDRPVQRYHNLYVYDVETMLRLYIYLNKTFPGILDEQGRLISCNPDSWDRVPEKIDSMLVKWGVKGLFISIPFSPSTVLVWLLNESIGEDLRIIEEHKAEYAEHYVRSIREYCPKTGEVGQVNMVVYILPIKREPFDERDRFLKLIDAKLGRILGNGGWTWNVGRWLFEVILSKRWIERLGVDIHEVFDQIRLAAREAFGRDDPIIVDVVDYYREAEELMEKPGQSPASGSPGHSAPTSTTRITAWEAYVERGVGVAVMLAVATVAFVALIAVKRRR